CREIRWRCSGNRASTWARCSGIRHPPFFAHRHEYSIRPRPYAPGPAPVPFCPAQCCASRFAWVQWRHPPNHSRSASDRAARACTWTFSSPPAYTKKPVRGFLIFFRVDFMTATAEFLYDQFPYEGFPITATHPDRIIPVGKLLGMNPAPATGCRVLELGCGDG